jgi:predicted hydrocarbon binding protein
MTIQPSQQSVSRLSQIMLEGVEEIAGRSGVRAALNAAELSNLYETTVVGAAPGGEFPFNEISAIESALEEMYGKRGGRGIALRAGRAAFKYVLRAYGASLSLLDLNYRLLPAPVRFRTGLDMLARLFSELGRTPIAVVESADAWFWRIERCPFCWQIKSNEPVCTFLVGFLQEFFTWASGGKVYHVQETECLAMGKTACVIRVEVRPLE